MRPIPDEIQALGTQVQLLGLEAAKLAPPDVDQIFTSYLSAQISGQRALGLMRDLAETRAAHYVPVWLTCHTEELARRMTLPERRQRAKMRDPDRLRDLLSERGVMPAPPYAMHIDTASLSPADAALLIAAHAGTLFLADRLSIHMKIFEARRLAVLGLHLGHAGMGRAAPEPVQQAV